MRRGTLIAVLVGLAMVAAGPGTARGWGHGWRSHGWSHRHSSGPRAPRRHRERLSYSVGRSSFGDAYDLYRPARGDDPGRRSTAAKNAFKRLQPCPATGLPTGPCPGYVIDHVIALKRGGADDPSNMQWQTTEDAKAKDKVE